MTDYLREELCIGLATENGGLFLYPLDGELKGMCATYVDDPVQRGDKDFQDLSLATAERFQCREREWDNKEFAGVQIETIDDKFKMLQKKYIEKESLRTLIYGLSSLRDRLLWLTISRPDISCSVGIAHSSLRIYVRRRPYREN